MQVSSRVGWALEWSLHFEHVDQSHHDTCLLMPCHIRSTQMIGVILRKVTIESPLKVRIHVAACPLDFR